MRCPNCGQDGLVYDDNWGQKPILREKITNEIHPCPLPIGHQIKNVREEIDNDYWICFHHRSRLEIYPKLRCPTKDCPQNSFIRKSYFDQSNPN